MEQYAEEQYAEEQPEETLEEMNARLKKIDEALVQALEIWNLAATQADKAVASATKARELYWTTKRLRAEAESAVNWKRAFQVEQERWR